MRSLEPQSVAVSNCQCRLRCIIIAGAPLQRLCKVGLTAGLQEEKSPIDRQGAHSQVSSLLKDKDNKPMIREHNGEKSDKLTAHGLTQAIGNYLNSTDTVVRVEEALLEAEQEDQTISIGAACIWLHRFGYSFRAPQKGIHVVDHERPDFVGASIEQESLFVQFDECPLD
ncbi:hypothetical protein K470DRAFT_81659 [Piedraia hortae CBS 480.64]|uniref:Uncharacterized protein n=1 Tax=Piedraia hortae CBS 480.64 TaxID=1314780 RepID=A0A6A7C8J2_9PEZI|nr:hypothetical protein K470DRAFT_81659 [Piedraia hortae CBS 480.64]